MSQWFGPLAPISQSAHTLVLKHVRTTLKLFSIYSPSIVQCFCCSRFAATSQKKMKQPAINQLIHFINKYVTVYELLTPPSALSRTRYKIQSVHFTCQRHNFQESERSQIFIKEKKSRRGELNTPGWRMTSTVGSCKTVYWPTDWKPKSRNPP